jgi:hypothetical protein
VERGDGSVWWHTIRSIREGVGQVDGGWLRDNISQRVGNGDFTLFWVDPWLDSMAPKDSYRRLYELANNKLAIVKNRFSMGWGMNGEAWKWCRRLFSWEEELLIECVGRLKSVVLQVGSPDQLIWHLHSSHCYSVSIAYNNLTDVDINQHQNPHQFVWLKVVPLKVSIFS